MVSKLSWLAVRKHLKEFCRDGLLVLIQDLFETFPEVRAYVGARYQLIDLEPYKEQIKKALKPKILREDECIAKVTFKIAEAKKVISSYRSATSDVNGEAWLMLYYLQLGVEHFLNFFKDDVYLEGKYLDSLHSVLRELCKLIQLKNDEINDLNELKKQLEDAVNFLSARVSSQYEETMYEYLQK